MSHHQPDLPWQPMLVKAAGAACCVGYHLAAASCAMRVGMAYFQESEFVERNGTPIKVAKLPMGTAWGATRLAEIAKLALKDCLQRAADFYAPSTAVILLAAERGRPHTSPERYNEIWLSCMADFTDPFHASSIILPQGRAGIGPALQFAQKLLTERAVANVVILGVDSFLDSATIEHYLTQDRLLTSKNKCGFIPGEAAAALMLQLSPTATTGLAITGLGIAKENAQFEGTVPNRAMGLTHAMRQACEMARLQPGEFDFRMSDQNGEDWFAKEMSNAFTRFSADDSVFLPMLHIADCVGETGAAAGVLSLAQLSTVMPRWDGPGQTGLLHFANDNGIRSAIVAQYFE